MGASATVGNDIVDLTDTEAIGKAHDVRFTKRILCSDEYQWFTQHRTDTALWLLWAAKEAAYKVFYKVFYPWHSKAPVARTLEVMGLSLKHRPNGTAHVQWQGHRVLIRWVYTDAYVHCLAWWPMQQNQEDDPMVTTAIDCAEVSMTTPPIASAAVRTLAKKIVIKKKNLIEPTQALEIIRRQGPQGLGPPRFYIDGRPLVGCDLSLSHHGRYVAAVVSFGEH